MKCHEARQLFFLYHDSELDPRSAEEINLHLETCPACREVWTRERRVEDAISRAAWTAAGPLEAFPWKDIEEQVRRRPATPSAARRWMVAAGLLLGLVAVVFALLQFGRSGPTVSTAARSAVEHHEKYLAGKSPLQVRGPDAAAVRSFYAGELGFEVLVPEGRSVEEVEGRPAELVGARRCTFLGGPVAYVTYRIDGKDVTAIVGPLVAPASVMEAISQSPEGCIEQEVRDCRVLVAAVRGVLFVAAGATEPETLRRLAETFQARGN
jgi:anti-sigma factor RsiW